MEATLRAAVEALIGRAGGAEATVRSSQPVGGGCIHRAESVELADGRRFFVKSNPAAPANIFEREAEGLAALAATETIRVPRAIGSHRGEGTAFLVLEAIEGGARRPDFSETFGRLFCQLHRAHRHRAVAEGDPAGRVERFGFDHDNHLGATEQPNTWTEDWCQFWRSHRLGHQLALARRRGLSDPTLERLGDRLLERLDQLIAEPEEPPCLLHGDLWSGNYMADEQGDPVLIDPAVYYGRREADLAMTHLFGGFDTRFYAAYEELWPLEPGSRERLEIYKLYHLLNHLNLFGRGYRDGCVSILRRFA